VPEKVIKVGVLGLLLNGSAFTGAYYQTPGVLDYRIFLRATQLCTNDMREKAIAFIRIAFNIAFNNRDDHPKNFPYLMSSTDQWSVYYFLL